MTAELEHADFLLTNHPKAGVALDLLLGTQGWRRFAEQDVAPANPSDRPHVDEFLVAHGHRPTAPLQLVQLEEQRINAQFAPRIEQARLDIAAAESRVKTETAPVSERVTGKRYSTLPSSSVLPPSGRERNSLERAAFGSQLRSAMVASVHAGVPVLSAGTISPAAGMVSTFGPIWFSP